MNIQTTSNPLNLALQYQIVSWSLRVPSSQDDSAREALFDDHRQHHVWEGINAFFCRVININLGVFCLLFAFIFVDNFISIQINIMTLTCLGLDTSLVHDVSWIILKLIKNPGLITNAGEISKLSGWEISIKKPPLIMKKAVADKLYLWLRHSTDVYDSIASPAIFGKSIIRILFWTYCLEA